MQRQGIYSWVISLQQQFKASHDGKYLTLHRTVKITYLLTEGTFRNATNSTNNLLETANRQTAPNFQNTSGTSRTRTKTTEYNGQSSPQRPPTTTSQKGVTFA